MSDPKKSNFTWPKRGPAERRLHPRVRVKFPILMEVEGEPRLEGMACDIGIGGVRGTVSHYIELFTRLALTLQLPTTARDGQMNMEIVEATVAVVRIEPDEETDGQVEYDVSLAFTGVSKDRDRIIGTFMLQTLLFDQLAEFT